MFNDALYIHPSNNLTQRIFRHLSFLTEVLHSKPCPTREATDKVGAGLGAGLVTSGCNQKDSSETRPYTELKTQNLLRCDRILN
ncbi:hypothetical protein [Coleofasciculus sp. G2-EDA-02]|uniref:hypothetical protein n=1 Tax=Coleofasciculus sp. G2-EDA-02 TaxID=3069529 RepID=UPI0032FCBA37